MAFARWKAPGAGHKFKAKACWVLADLSLIEEELATPEMIEFAKRARKGDPTKTRRFSSKKEAKRWIGLNLLLRAGEIRDLRAQVPIDLYGVRPDGLKEVVCRYIADFVYFDVFKGREIVEDCKGMRVEPYITKAKWFAVQHGFQIEEV
jgi:hypothetical protein